MPSVNLTTLIVDSLLPYQARYIPLAGNSRPSTCIIPPLLPGTVILSPLEPITISADCKVDFIETTLFPIPYAPPVDLGSINIPCPDGYTFSGGIEFKIGNEVLAPSRNTVTLTPFQCSTTLGGRIQLDLPEAYCPNGLTFSGEIPVKINGIAATENNKIKLVSSSNHCGATLSGGIDINVPVLSTICPTGLAFDGAIGIKLNNGTVTSTVTNTVSLRKKDDGCGATLSGDINFQIPELHCGDGFRFDGETVINVNGVSASGSDNAGTIRVELDSTNPIYHPGVNYRVDDIITVAGGSVTADEFRARFRVTAVNPNSTGGVTQVVPFNGGGAYVLLPTPLFGVATAVNPSGGLDLKLNLKRNNKISLQRKADGCGATLVGNIDLIFPTLNCPAGFTFGGGFLVKANNTIFENTIKLEANPNGCGAQLTGELDLGSMPGIRCAGGFSFAGNSHVSVNGTQLPDTLGLVENIDGCGASLTGNIALDKIMIWRGTWQAGVAYHPYDVVSYGSAATGGSRQAVVLTDHISSSTDGPGLDNANSNANWLTLAGNALRWRGTWQAGVTYYPGDVVSYGSTATGGSREAVVLKAHISSSTDGPGLDNANSNANWLTLAGNALRWRGTWQAGTQYHPYDVVTFDTGGGGTGTAIALSLSLGQNPQQGMPWFVMGSGGTTTTTTATKLRHPFEVIHLGGNRVTVHAMSSLWQELDIDKTIPIGGLDSVFELNKEEIVYLEVVFDVSKPAIPVVSANIAKGTTWDPPTPSVISVISVYPKISKTLLKTAFQLELDGGTDNKVAKAVKQWIQYLSATSQTTAAYKADVEKIEEVVSAFGATQVPVTRFFKAYVLIGYALKDQEGGTFTLTKDSTNYGFIQTLDHHLLLFGRMVNGLPGWFPTPYYGTKRPQVPKVVVAKQDTTAVDNVAQVNVTFSGPTFSTPPKSSDARIYYTVDGTDPYLPDKTTPKLNVSKYSAEFKAPKSATIKAFAVQPDFISSALTTS